MGYYSSYVKTSVPRNAYPDVLERIALLKEECDISPNVSSFLSSIAASFKRHGGITEKQYEAFCDIEKSYYEQLPAPTPDWNEKYDDEKRESAKICALYYRANPPYYGDLAYRVLYDKDFIPTEKQYVSLTQNKYAKKVIESHHSKPRFEANDYVALRKNNPCNIDSDNNLFIVIQVAPEPITTAAKNTKKYKILQIDDTATHIVEERWLKYSSKK